MLSSREQEILVLVARGASNKEIARDLHISSNTVKVHMRNIFAKIEANSRTEAAMYAVNAGLVEVESNGTSVTTSPITPIDRWLIFAGIGIITVVLVIIAAVILFYRQNPQVNGVGANVPILEDAQRWQTKAPMPEARKGLALTSLGGQIYAIAGQSDQEVSGTVERYDPVQNDWTKLTSKPIPVTDISAASIGGKIFVPGGRTATGEVTNALEIYSPGEDAWEKGSSLPAGLSSYGMVPFEGYLYVFGGWDGNQVLNSVYQYDPEFDQWQELTPMPTARSYLGVSVVEDKIFVIGGFDGEKPLATAEVYTPSLEGSDTSPWEIDQPLPESIYAMGVVSLADRIYIIGGESSSEETLGFIEYASDSGNWQQIGEPIAADWSYLGAIPVGTYIYLIGGEMDGTITNNNLAYQALYTIAIPIVR